MQLNAHCLLNVLFYLHNLFGDNINFLLAAYLCYMYVSLRGLSS
jgi:hypothetical protein